MVQNVNLKPCPFCGGKAVLYDTPSMSVVMCISCRSSTKLFISYPGQSINPMDDAINAWNRRVGDSDEIHKE